MNIMDNYNHLYGLNVTRQCLPIKDLCSYASARILGIDRLAPDAEVIKVASERLGINFFPNAAGLLPDMRATPLEFYPGVLPYKRAGFDPVCGEDDIFSASDGWFRDTYRSRSCNTQPRERAVKFVLESVCPFWRDLAIHESSPNAFGLSKVLRNAKNYTASQYSSTVACGKEAEPVLGAISVNLEDQSCIESESFDAVVTQDVFEHVYDAKAAFQEIARTLKPGGFHIFTTPLERKNGESAQLAYLQPDGRVLLDGLIEIHGNPMGTGGALKTISWGYDIVDFIYKHTGMDTRIVYVESEYMGIHLAEYREVLVSVKPPVPSDINTSPGDLTRKDLYVMNNFLRGNKTCLREEAVLYHVERDPASRHHRHKLRKPQELTRSPL